MENKQSLILLFFTLIFGFSACKKEIENPEKIDHDTKEDLIKDSVFYYTKFLSLWQEYMPPRNVDDILRQDVLRKYTQAFSSGEEVLYSLVKLTPNDPLTNRPIDRFSFLDRDGEISGEMQGIATTSFGVTFFFLQDSEERNRYDLSVQMVDKASPAYTAGMRRGDKVLSINGDDKIVSVYGDNPEDPLLGKYLTAGSMIIKFVNKKGVVIEKEITSGTFIPNPILADNILDLAGKKVGYLAFNSFLNIDESVGTNGEGGVFVKTDMYHAFEKVFKNFESAGVDELVVDLRYNGGGSVLTVEYLADKIVPSAMDKKLMYTNQVNGTLESWGWLDEGDEFGPVYFSKKGHLNLRRVYFLVTSATASASELLMNVLEPHMEVYIVGTYSNRDGNQIADNTYGKPVGFFGIPIVDPKIELYVTSFMTINSDNNKGGKSSKRYDGGEYFGGMKPDAHVWEFGSFADFGNKEESMLSAALNHIQTGSFESLTRSISKVASSNMRKERPKSHIQIGGSKLKNGMYKFPKRNLLK